MSEQFDPWAPSTGLVDSYEGEVKTATFGFDAQYNNGQSCVLILEVKTDAPELAEQDGIDRLLLSVGDGWVPKEKGARVEREDGKSKGFNNQSGVWLWITAAIESGAGEAMKAKGTPFEAKTYLGLRFAFERQGYKDLGGKDRSRMLPAKFLSRGGAGSTESPASGSEAPANGAAALVKAKLTALAKECDTHDSFVERAFTEINGVAGDSELEAAVMDASALYEPARS